MCSIKIGLYCWHGICTKLGHWYLAKLSIQLFFFSILTSRRFRFFHQDILFLKLSSKDMAIVIFHLSFVIFIMLKPVLVKILNNMVKLRESIILPQKTDWRDIEWIFEYLNTSSQNFWLTLDIPYSL